MRTVTGAALLPALAEPSEAAEPEDEPPEEQPAMRRAPAATAVPTRTGAPARKLRIKFPFPIDLLGYKCTIYQTGKLGNSCNAARWHFLHVTRVIDAHTQCDNARLVIARLQESPSPPGA